jgi:hypothetical protein
MNKSALIEHLKSQEIWSIEEVLKLFYGPSNPSDIIRGETHEPMGELLETAANQGRFGMLATGIDKFHWNMELLQGGRYPDEPLDTITDFSAHHLRFLDWIKDEDVLDKIQLDADRKEDILDLIETLNSKRLEVKSVTHDIDYKKLVEDDFWSLTDLRIVLFGTTYSSRYWPSLYHKYNCSLEALMQRTDKVIQDAALVGRHIEVHKIPNRLPLIDSDREDEIDRNSVDLKDYGGASYDGIYDTDENEWRSQRYYHTPDLFNILTLKGFPIPKGLATSLNQNKIKPALELLKKLRENILYLAVHGKNPSNIQMDTVKEKGHPDNKEIKDQEDYFVKDGDYWFVYIDGEQASHLRHSIGMTYIWVLHQIYDTGDSQRKIEVMELERLIRNPPDTSTYEQKEWNPNIGQEHKSNKTYSPFELATGLVGMNKNRGLGTSEPVITTDILKAINARIKSLNKELIEPIRIIDKEKEEEISGEIDKLEAFVSANTFNGRIKTVTQPEIEKARQNVQKAIKAAINNIKKKNKVLGVHLDNCIHTGKFCSYRP